MEMELNKHSDLLEKMQHHPSSSSSAAPTRSEVKASRYRPFARRSPPDPNQIRKSYRDFIVDVNLDDIPYPSPPAARLVEMGFDDQVFDVKHLTRPRFGGEAIAIHDFKKDPSKFLLLTKSATLAIQDYNSQTLTDYQFLHIEMVSRQLVNGILYHITFQAMNAAHKEHATFEATVLNKCKIFRKVKRIRMKESSTWYNGTLMQLEDDDPVIMDVKDGDDVYALMKTARELRKPDMGFVMAKQDEGAEAAGAILE